jgi:hypothetical protein
MRPHIGETAGKIWQTLRSKNEVNVVQLPRLLKEKSVVVYQALGWLACEDKITYRTQGDKTFVSLNDTEKHLS